MEGNGGKKERKALLKALSGEASQRTPLWFMRQAGRYLPEYRALREGEKDFLRFCLSPKLATEAALQPLRRFDLDAAILFSDILVIPHALGQRVSFEEGVGPLLDPLSEGLSVSGLSFSPSLLEPVYEAVSRIREAIPRPAAMIGFAGAPWTVACYMIAGRGAGAGEKARGFLRERPQDFSALLEILMEATEHHLKRQLDAGAEVLQIFDSFAGALMGGTGDDEAARDFSLKPIIALAERVKAHSPSAKVIAFPKGAGALYRDYLQSPFIDAVSMDETLSASWAVSHLQELGCVQGNLAPSLLVEGGDLMISAAQKIWSLFHEKPYIFSLGHGILPQTPPDHVADLIAHIRLMDVSHE